MTTTSAKAMTASPRPITHREMLLCSIPLAILYLLQLGTSKGLSLSGLLSMATYLAFMTLVLPRLYRRPLTIVSMLLLGGGFALALSLTVNIVHMAFAPWSNSAYFLLVGLSGVDGPSLMIPAFVLLARSTQALVRLAKSTTLWKRYE